MTDIIIAVLGFVSAVVVAVINTNVRFKRLEDEVAKSVKYQKENYMSLLRLTVMSEEMPIDERITAGKTYVDKGGNGGVKQYYHDFLEKHIVKESEDDKAE